MNINASLIRALNKANHCPAQIKAKFIDGIKSDLPSEAMLSGTFFEAVTTGYDPNFMIEMNKCLSKFDINYNNIPSTSEIYYNALKSISPQLIIPEHLVKSKIKDKYGPDTWKVELSRIFYQAAGFYRIANRFRLFNNPFSVHKRISSVWNRNDSVNLHGEYDINGILVVSDENGSLVEKEYIIDLKLTANLRSEYGDFAWGMPHLMDHTQPKMYIKIMALLDDKIRSFMYWVFDKKAIPEFKPIEINYTKLEDAELDESIRKTHELISIYILKDWPEITNFKTCERCLLKDNCNAYKEDPPIPSIFQL